MIKDKMIQIRVSKKFLEKIKKIVNKEERTISDLTRQLYNEYINKYEKM